MNIKQVDGNAVTEKQTGKHAHGDGSLGLPNSSMYVCVCVCVWAGGVSLLAQRVADCHQSAAVLTL